MPHRPVARVDARRVLVSVTNAREVVRAGLGGARLSVRTLDQISCHVHAGELLTLRGGVASGALSLLRALHGSSPRIRAEHHAAPHVQLRRATISAVAAFGIESGWRDIPDHTGVADRAHDGAWRQYEACPRGARGQRPPVVYLLRVRPLQPGETLDAPSLGSEMREATQAWHAWAQAVRDSGGAVVLAVQTPLTAIPRTQTRPTIRGARLVPSEVRERATASADNTRTLTLHAGQFFNADPDARLPC